MQSKPITPTSAPDEGDIFSEEGSFIRSDVHHASNGLHSDEELDLFTGISPHRCTITAMTLDMNMQARWTELHVENIMHSVFVFNTAWQVETDLIDAISDMWK